MCVYIYIFFLLIFFYFYFYFWWEMLVHIEVSHFWLQSCLGKFEYSLSHCWDLFWNLLWICVSSHFCVEEITLIVKWFLLWLLSYCIFLFLLICSLRFFKASPCKCKSLQLRVQMKAHGLAVRPVWTRAWALWERDR